MINREDWYMIQDMREKGCYISDIAETVGCCEKTVSRALKRGGPPPRRKTGVRASKLDPFKEQIDQLLAENVWNSEVIYAHIKERGYCGGRTILRTYIQPKRALRRSKATVRFETDAGEQLQHDWTELFCTIAAETKKVFVSVNTLSYSRRFHAWAACTHDAEHTYESIIRAFEWFGGGTKEVLVDNQKAAVVHHDRQRGVRFTPGFRLLSSHYGFTPKACRPARPQTKGKDERMIGYLKYNFFKRYRRFDSMDDLNRLLEKWLIEVADQRFHGTVKEVVCDRFERELPQLQSLPPVRFDTSYRQYRRVALDGYIDVRGNRYSVPGELCGTMVAVRIGLDGQLRVYGINDELVARHRLREKGWSTVADHHRRLWQQAFPVVTRDLQVYEEVGSWS